MKNRIAAATLIISCLLLAVYAFTHFQSRPLPGSDGLLNSQDIAGEPANPVASAEAITSIRAQLDAFRHNDYVKASYYQSPELRISTGSPEQFRNMMVTNYPAFTNFVSVQFGEVRSSLGGQEVMVPVEVTGKNGGTETGLYMLQRDRDGIYRVMSVAVGQR